MRVSRHNGRSGKHGVYNPKHNDRRFDVQHSEHIDPERKKENLYWDCYHGISKDGKPAEMTFEQVEEKFYEEIFADFIQGQNARNIKNRHPERNRTVKDLLNDKRTCPEETIYQIGNIDSSIDYFDLYCICQEFFDFMERVFGENVKIIDWALHVDEGTPHIHERHVFVWENQYGELCPKQEKALEEIGFELPDPSKKQGKNNNRKMVFDDYMRHHFIIKCHKFGIEVESEAIYGGRQYLEKQDYIIQKQQEKIAEKEQKIKELEEKILDSETLIQEVSAVAYEKAVEIVSDKAREEALNTAEEQIEIYKKWLSSPDRKASEKMRNYAISQMESLGKNIRSAIKKLSTRLEEMFKKSNAKKEMTEMIEKESRDSVLEKLEWHKLKVSKKNIAEKDSRKIERKCDINF
ncbi:serine/arginine repetitive matrix protein 2 [Blautia sp. XA-2221]|uniref:serine/arginine repetitive matrix protein 2 n=1 Tax=Blautia sp. XA-2221 TaxID=2903961 RepID=UPI0023782A97|nr:serine/arginine repetitive matrix protein 2 [Blautia sp. XA-2221]